MKRNMTARDEARKVGAKIYETGVPCKQGHLAPRATLTGTCVECTRLAKLKWLEKNPNKAAEYTAAYRHRNPEAIRANDARTLAERRKADPDKYRDYKKEYYRKKIAKTENREVRESSKLPIAELVSRLQGAHAGNLQYLGGYVSMNDKALFYCVTHKTEVEAQPNNVLKGANPCPNCNHMKSGGEAEVFALLSNLTHAESRNRTVLKPKELDIYLPEKNLAVEYCGEFWHSSGTKDDELKKRNQHIEKYLDCKAQGIRLITLWESEWREHNYAVRRLLRNAAGKSKGKLMARKCELKRVSHAEAQAFYDRYHPQGGAGSGEHFALFWKSKMVACMRFVLGANDRGAGAANRVWTLGRYATRVTVAGAASRLFKAFVQDYNPTVVKSFSDNRFFGGGMYAQLGFVMEEEVGADYQVWSPKLGLRHKSHYQRRQLPKRLEEHGMNPDEFDPVTDQRTEAEMTYLMGCRRIYDCGKKRWVWTAPQ